MSGRPVTGKTRDDRRGSSFLRGLTNLRWAGSRTSGIVSGLVINSPCRLWLCGLFLLPSTVNVSNIVRSPPRRLHWRLPAAGLEHAQISMSRLTIRRKATGGRSYSDTTVPPCAPTGRAGVARAFKGGKLVINATTLASPIAWGRPRRYYRRSDSGCEARRSLCCTLEIASRAVFPGIALCALRRLRRKSRLSDILRLWTESRSPGVCLLLPGEQPHLQSLSVARMRGPRRSFSDALLARTLLHRTAPASARFARSIDVLSVVRSGSTARRWSAVVRDRSL